MHSRPKSKNTIWEEPPQEGEPFNYDAVPSRFYFDVESIGNIEPDAVIQEGIKVLQVKLAEIIAQLSGGDSGTDGMDVGDNYMPQSPDMGMNGGGGGGGWNDQGYTTPYNSGGQTNPWGGQGSATPYGATPYGQPAANGW
jgi:DNA-directed RNA polymerase II subunit RPB3